MTSSRFLVPLLRRETAKCVLVLLVGSFAYAALEAKSGDHVHSRNRMPGVGYRPGR